MGTLDNEPTQHDGVLFVRGGGREKERERERERVRGREGERVSKLRLRGTLP